ncbi:MAG TPA: neprosin family prolyl endopeptidase [Candidatus Saccharimonadales bacterium]|nr:neprosin family prolyl endopeptidase [Candidatus Saccharimonadales bacterium]
MSKKTFFKRAGGMFDQKTRQVLASSAAVVTLLTGLVVPLGIAQAAQSAPTATLPTARNFVSDPSDPTTPGPQQSSAMKLPPKPGTFKGELLTPKNVVRNKHLPPVASKSVRAPMSTLSSCPGGCYYYNVGSQGFTTTLPTGTYANYSAISPTLDTTNDFHTLAEVANQKTVGGKLQIVELGVTVDQSVNGDTQPRLFAFAWVNDNGLCYNGCGWTDVGGVTPNLGDVISANQKLGLEHFTSAQATPAGWWAWVGNTAGTSGNWVAYIADTVWTGATPSVTTFTNEDFAQVFGEIAAGDNVASTVCTDMGTSTLATTSVGASIGSTQYIGLSTSAVNLYDREAPSGIDPYWNVAELGTPGNIRSFRYGGPGGC